VTLRDRWLDFWHALPPFRGRLAIARIVAQHLLTTRRNSVAWATLPNGFRLKVDLRWQGGYDTLYYFRTYEPPLAALIERAIDADGATFVDVGANIGVFCVLVADVLRRRGGRAIAIEPLPQNLAFLRESIDANALADVIVPLPVAVGDRAGTLELMPLTSGEIANARPTTWASGDATPDVVSVPMTTLDAVAHEQALRNVRFVKIDIEGAELFALRGATELLRTHRPLVYCEFHREYMAANGTTLEDVRDFAASIDFTVEFLGPDGRVTPNEPARDSRFLDAVLLPRDLSADQRRVLGR